MKKKIEEKEKMKKRKCIYCKRLVKVDLLYGDGVCKQCIEAGRPPFKWWSINRSLVNEKEVRRNNEGK